jgi:hypothetical protein
MSALVERMQTSGGVEIQILKLDAFRAQLTVRFTSKRFVRPTRPGAPATRFD